MRIEDESDGSAIEAEIRHGAMILCAEQDDPEGGVGAIVRVHFMPTKRQAEELAALLVQWAHT